MPSQNNSASDSTSTRLLEDLQVKVSATTVERYYHFTTRIDNASGLDDLSQIRFYYEPSYQQLAIHYVRILRDKQSLNALRPSEIKIIQQEDALDQQLYNGTQAALIFVNDLRVGDVVEYAYTITGQNPVLGGRFADTFYLAQDEPVEEFHLRLLYPTNRELFIKNENTDLQPGKQLIGDSTEYTWQQKYVREIKPDGSTPSWFSPFPRITVSEFGTWSDVVNWAMPYYRISPAGDATLQSRIDKWKNNLQSPEERALAALRFVQDEIRYLGIELGTYSHQPTQPTKVLARRFGDCKDKSLLLATIYTAMGIEAYPALVNSYARAGVDSWQPSPFAFNHVIVKANVSGKTYWFDPTITYQRGDLDHYYSPKFERALVLRAGTGELEPIPRPASDIGSTDIVEIYSREPGQPAIALNVTTTYRGSDADEMRYDLSLSSLDELGRSYLNFYADSTPKISADGPPAVQDDERTNTIVIKEKYLIANLWVDDKHRFLAEKIWRHLYKPRVSQRTMPLTVSYPLSIRQKIIIDLGPGYYLPLGSDVMANEAMRFDYRISKNGDRLEAEYSLQTFRDSVPVEKISQHLALLDRAQDAIGFDLPRSSMAVVETRGIGPSSSPRTSIVSLVSIVALVLFVSAFLIWMARGHLRRPSAATVGSAVNQRVGGSPALPLRVASEEDLQRALSDFKCRCGSHPYNSSRELERDGMTYDGNHLVAIQMKCEKCRQVNDLYVRFPTRDESGERKQRNELLNNEILD